MIEKSARVVKVLTAFDTKGWMKRSVLFTMQKLNILIFGLNKLENANMGFLLGFKIRKRMYRGGEVHHTLLNQKQKK